MDYIIDTNIISALMKNDSEVKVRLQNTFLNGSEVFISGLSYYEIKRGLLAISATNKLRIFNEICRRFRILLLDDIRIFDMASEIYADLKQKGKLIKDADILIASTALVYEITLVSDDSDFIRIDNLSVENWIKRDNV
jgi:tRNA(fMet)-specific endonuclease VapC